MAKISQLTATTSPADTDSLPIENTSGTITTKRITISSLASTIANKVRSLLSIGSASSLKTSSKEIVGAVNEVHDGVNSLIDISLDHDEALADLRDSNASLSTSVAQLNSKIITKLGFNFITLSDADGSYMFGTVGTEKTLTLNAIKNCVAVVVKVGMATSGEASMNAGYLETTMFFSQYSGRTQDTQGFCIYTADSWHCFGSVNVNFTTGTIRYKMNDCAGWTPTNFLIKRVVGFQQG